MEDINDYVPGVVLRGGFRALPEDEQRRQLAKRAIRLNGQAPTLAPVTVADIRRIVAEVLSGSGGASVGTQAVDAAALFQQTFGAGPIEDVPPDVDPSLVGTVYAR